MDPLNFTAVRDCNYGISSVVVALLWHWSNFLALHFTPKQRSSAISGTMPF